jgi:endonuclease/exonuclease/phosphatase family metal-dependent hydrolase
MATATVHFRIASFNVKGGADTPYGSWATRLPKVVATMRQADADIYLIQEARISKNHPQQILAELEKQTGDTGWHLVRGPNAIHILHHDRNKQVQHIEYDIGDDRDYIELNLWNRATGVRFWCWVTHLIAADEDAGRTTEEAAALRREEASRIVRPDRLERLHRVVGGGDINSHHVHETSLAAIWYDAGHDDVRTRVDTVENGELDSNDDFLPNPMLGEWIDRLFAGPLCQVTAAGLVDSGTASDHNLIWADCSITGTVTSF